MLKNRKKIGSLIGVFVVAMIVGGEGIALASSQGATPVTTGCKSGRLCLSNDTLPNADFQATNTLWWDDRSLGDNSRRNLTLLPDRYSTNLPVSDNVRRGRNRMSASVRTICVSTYSNYSFTGTLPYNNNFWIPLGGYQRPDGSWDLVSSYYLVESYQSC
jgi:hypothetical protein